MTQPYYDDEYGVAINDEYLMDKILWPDEEGE